MEYYLKLFHPHLHSLFDYLPRNTLVCRYGRLNASANQFWSDIKLRYEDRCVDPQRPILKPSSIFVNPDEIFVRFKDYPGIILEEPRDQSSAAVKFNIKANPDLPINSNLHGFQGQRSSG